MTKAINERDPFSPWFNVSPWLAPLRDDPRFHDLLRRMNLMSHGREFFLTRSKFGDSPRISLRDKNLGIIRE